MRFGHGQAKMSSSRSQKKWYQPGGTALFTKGNILERIVEKGSDEIGRYKWVQLNVKNNN